MNMRDALAQLRLSGIALEIAGEEPYRCGGTRFGGRPDVPPGFVWPYFEGVGLEDGEKKRRPLAFLAQFALEEMQPFDAEHLLPAHGVLSFFYEVESQPWGFDPQDAGCARVFWFEDAATLAPAEYPPDLSQEAHFPALHMDARQAFFYPEWEDFELAWPDADVDDFEETRDLLNEEAEDGSRLLGWPEILQNNMTRECELVTQGYYLGDNWGDVPDEVYRRAKQTSLNKWRLLFQLGPVASGDFELMFGDGGNLYFYISKEDLLARRFERAWLISQCG